MSHQRRWRSMQLTLPARCHHNPNSLKLIVNYHWIVSIYGKHCCLVIETVSEKIWKLLKMHNIIWIAMEPSCMLLCHLQQLMGSWWYVLSHGLLHYNAIIFVDISDKLPLSQGNVVEEKAMKSTFQCDSLYVGKST